MPASHEAPHPPQPLEAALTTAHNRFPGFFETDMQFNVGRIEGVAARGLDIFTDQGRYLVTEHSDPAAEARIAQSFGTQAVLSRIFEERATSVYEVPKGSRLLLKTLRRSPYSERYTHHLAGKLGRFLRSLRTIDDSLFGGVDVTMVAVTHDGEDAPSHDDIYLTVVPPVTLARPDAPRLSHAEVVRHNDALLPPELVDAFNRGYLGD
jgi:hypothetical protein